MRLQPRNRKNKKVPHGYLFLRCILDAGSFAHIEGVAKPLVCFWLAAVAITARALKNLGAE